MDVLLSLMPRKTEREGTREEVILALGTPSPARIHFVYHFSSTFWTGDFDHFSRLKSFLDLGDKMTSYPSQKIFFKKFLIERRLQSQSGYVSRVQFISGYPG